MTTPRHHGSPSAQPVPGPLLRSYAPNSAEAAARIVALALIANGRIKAVETAALEALRGHERLGLTRPQWHGVIQELCADLLGRARCGDEGCVSEPMLYGADFQVRPRGPTAAAGPREP